jgi:hypothetical protein
VRQERRALLAFKERRVFKARQVLPEPLEHRVSPGNKAHKARLGIPAR